MNNTVNIIIAHHIVGVPAFDLCNFSKMVMYCLFEAHFQSYKHWTRKTDAADNFVVSQKIWYFEGIEPPSK